MTTLKLYRISTDLNVGTFGVLKWADRPAPFALSLENPWLDNKTNVSCIPSGDYKCLPFNSPTHGKTFIVTDVPGRTFILFHRGNTHLHTAGCVLIGEQFEYLDGIPAITHSRKGWDEFWSRAKDLTEIDLVIRWTDRKSR